MTIVNDGNQNCWNTSSAMDNYRCKSDTSRFQKLGWNTFEDENVTPAPVNRNSPNDDERSFVAIETQLNSSYENDPVLDLHQDMSNQSDVKSANSQISGS